MFSSAWNQLKEGRKKETTTTKKEILMKKRGKINLATTYHSVTGQTPKCAASGALDRRDWNHRRLICFQGHVCHPDFPPKLVTNSAFKPFPVARVPCSSKVTQQGF